MYVRLLIVITWMNYNVCYPLLESCTFIFLPFQLGYVGVTSTFGWGGTLDLVIVLEIHKLDRVAL